MENVGSSSLPVGTVAITVAVTCALRLLMMDRRAAAVSDVESTLAWVPGLAIALEVMLRPRPAPRWVAGIIAVFGGVAACFAAGFVDGAVSPPSGPNLP